MLEEEEVLEEKDELQWKGFAPGVAPDEDFFN